MAVCLLLAGAPVAIAQVGNPGDISQLTDEQKQELTAKLKDVASAAVCDDSDFGKTVHLFHAEGLCSGAVKGLVTGPDAGKTLTPEVICLAVTQPAPILKDTCTGAAVGLGKVAEAVQQSQLDFLRGIAGAAVAVVKATKFIENPAGAMDDAANAAKADAVGMTGNILGLLTRVTSFNPGAEWFLATWAATSGVGFIIMAVSVLLTMTGANSGKYSLEEARKGITDYAPFAVFVLVFGPALGVVVSGVIDLLSEGIGSWAGTPIDNFARLVKDIAGVTAGDTMGSFVGLVLFAAMCFGALGTYGNLIVQMLGANMVGIMLSVMVGILIHPLWRRRLAKVAALFAGILLTKPALFLVIGIVFSMGGAIQFLSGDPDANAKTFTTILMLALAMLILTFAPWSLLKYVPLLKTTSGGKIEGGVGSAAAGAAAGTGASFMTTMMMQKANNHAKRNHTHTGTGNGPEPAGPAGTTSGPGRHTSGQDTGGQGPGGQQPAANRAGQTAAAKNTPAATAAGAGKSGMAGMAPLAVMQAAMAAAKAAKSKAAEHANTAVHDVRGES
ncbi:hypothetical protein [Arthrobacter sp. NyZ413]|uniref:hypothetical protein n=1 Tax=Arthrobacter sp. NyZ413 TaxID=3144669 RepID=UPI003BF77403